MGCSSTPWLKLRVFLLSPSYFSFLGTNLTPLLRRCPSLFQLLALLPEKVQQALVDPVMNRFQHLGDDVKSVVKAMFSSPPTSVSVGC